MNRPDWQGENEHVDKHLANPRSHPKDVVIEAVAWVHDAVDPAPLQRNATRQRGNGAADPPAKDDDAGDYQLAAKGSINRE